MEKFQESLIKAKKNLHVADHMVFITYNVVKDPKLLFSALKNIQNSMISTTDALLQFERLFKQIPAIPQTFSAKLLMLKSLSSKRHNLSQNYIFLMNELHEVIQEHEKSPVEFARKDKFVICSRNYRLKTITISKIKEYLAINKSYLQEVKEIIQKKDGIFS